MAGAFALSNPFTILTDQRTTNAINGVSVNFIFIISTILLAFKTITARYLPSFNTLAGIVQASCFRSDIYYIQIYPFCSLSIP